MATTDRFNEVMDRLGSRVYTLARYSLASAQDAEDVTQDVFTRLWENWNSIDLDRVEGWLIRVANNACVDLQRRRAVRRSHEADNSSSGWDSSTTDHDPAAIAETAELRDHVTTSIARLREPFRSILILREIEGLSYDEICQSLGLSLPQVKVYLHRARARLAQELANLDGECPPSPRRTQGSAHVL